MGLGWGLIFMREYITNLITFWLPLCNILFILFVIYVDHDLESLVHDSEELERVKYDFKKV